MVKRESTQLRSSWFFSLFTRLFTALTTSLLVASLLGIGSAAFAQEPAASPAGTRGAVGSASRPLPDASLLQRPSQSTQRLVSPASLAGSEVKATRSGKSITLTQKEVARIALGESFRSKEALFNAEVGQLQMYEALKNFSFVFGAEGGVENSLANSISPQSSSLVGQDTYTTKLTLSKPMTTGTLLGLEYSRDSRRFEFVPNASNVGTATQTLDQAGITLEQKLWNNSFGTADRASIRAGAAGAAASRLGRFLDQQNVVLDAIRQFWQTYVAQETFQEALNSRERYEKLVDVVRRKNQLGYAAPGELAQVQAELELRIQNAKTQANAYLAAAEQMITLLGLEQGLELNFATAKDLPPLPNFDGVSLESLRPLKQQQQNLEKAEAGLTAAASQAWPDLALVARYYSTGADQIANIASTRVWSGNFPRSYIGLKFTYAFGESYSDKNESAKRAQRNLEQSKLDRLRRETRDRLEQIRRNVIASFAIAESAQRQRDFRERASQELQRAYTQGRTDISNLITSLNGFFDAKVALSRAIGNYQIALNEWSAAVDQLILSEGGESESN